MSGILVWATNLYDAPFIPAKRTCDAALSADEVAKEIRLGSPISSRSLQLGTSPRRQTDIQGPSLGCHGRVAIAHGMMPGAGRGHYFKRRAFRNRLTAPNVGYPVFMSGSRRSGKSNSAVTVLICCDLRALNLDHSYLVDLI